MPQFEFLVMTEKTFIVIKYFRFEFIFYVKIATPPPKKSHPLFPSNLPLKVDVLSSPFFLKIWLGGGVHITNICTRRVSFYPIVLS